MAGCLQHQLINKKATLEMVENAFNLLEGVLDYKKFQDVELVIEVGYSALWHYFLQIARSNTW